MNIPNDADGDVIRRLMDSGFDFSNSADVEFEVDFEVWPPRPEAVYNLKQLYQQVEIFEPDGDFNGYVLITISSIVSYQFVTSTQNKITELVSQYGGKCEAWGLLH